MNATQDKTMSQYTCGQTTSLLRKEVVTWYEKSILGDCVGVKPELVTPDGMSQRSAATFRKGRGSIRHSSAVLDRASLEQVTKEVRGEHGVLNDGSTDPITHQVSLWDSEYREYLQTYVAWISDCKTILESDEPWGAPPAEPPKVDSPIERWAASSAKAMQVIEMMILWGDLPGNCMKPMAFSPMDGMTPEELRNLSWCPHRPRPLFRFYLALLGMYVMGVAEKFLKLKLDTLSGRSKDQSELPSVSSPFSERGIRSCRMYGGRGSREWAHWLTTSRVRTESFVAWMKRGAPAMSESLMTAAKADALKILCKPHVPPPTPIYGRSLRSPPGVTPSSSSVLNLQFEDVEKQVRRRVREMKFPQWSEEMPTLIPSTHAHFEWHRGDGGAAAFVASEQPHPTAILRRLEITLGDVSLTRDEIISRALSHDHPDGPYLRRCGFLPYDEEIRNTSRLMHWFDEAVERWLARDVCQHVTPRSMEWRDEHLAGRDRTLLLPAKIVALAEPLKIRIITTGPESDYYWAAYLQKFLHGHARKCPIFKLIGDPLTLADINVTFRKPIGPDEFYVSGDYKAATNLISGKLSEACADEIAIQSGMPHHIRQLFKATLTGHMVHISERQRNVQANGQLMGSPSSFPVLCIINAALTLYALELNQAKLIDMTGSPILINGDDVVFPTNTKGYEIWKKVTALGGLVFSQGKNFTSRDFLIINSCLFNAKYHQPMPMRSSGNRYEERGRGEPSRVRFTSDPTLPLVVVRNPIRPALPSRVIHDTEVEHLYQLKLVPDQPKSLSYGWAGGGSMCFTVEPWQNPDFLGPVGRYLPGNDHLLCPALVKLRLKSLDDLFEPDGYAILPGLQQAWLGSIRTTAHRHALNLVWLRSWKPVLDLTKGVHREVKFSTNYFLPCELGGLGLEETSGKRIEEFASHATRQLAFWLWKNPSEAPMCAPSLAKKTPLEASVMHHIRQLPVQYIPKSVTPTSDQLSHADLLTSINRSVWMRSFSMEKAGPNFSRGLEKNERAEFLEEQLCRWTTSIRRLWMPRSKHGVKDKWMKCPAMTQEEFLSWIPQQRVYGLLVPTRYRTSLRPPGAPVCPDSQLARMPETMDIHDEFIGPRGFADLVTGDAGASYHLMPEPRPVGWLPLKSEDAQACIRPVEFYPVGTPGHLGEVVPPEHDPLIVWGEGDSLSREEALASRVLQPRGPDESGHLTTEMS